MALDADRLEQRFISIFRTAVRELYPNEVKNTTVTEVKREDGSLDHEINEERGPMEVDTEKLTPLARALARAVVQEITASAEVTTTAASGTWRVS